MRVVVNALAKIETVEPPVSAAKGTREIGSRVPEQLIINHRSANIRVAAAELDETLVWALSAA
jgi:hypothetical protein